MHPTNTRTIPGLADPRIVGAFFGDRAEPYDYEVVDALAGCEVVDSRIVLGDDMEPPGHYYGVEVPAELARKWDEGIDACKKAGVQTRSREGLVIRYRIMCGGDTLPPELEEIAVKWDEGVRRRDDLIAQNRAVVASYRAVLEGYTSVGADEYSGQFWTVEKRKQLPRVWDSLYPPREDSAPGSGNSVQIYRLPNGDLMSCSSESWTRHTKYEATVADRRDRAQIKGYIYREPLRSALAAAERSDALKSGILGSWLGGTPTSEFDKLGLKKNYAGSNARYPHEQVAELRQYILKVIEKRHQQIRWVDENMENIGNYPPEEHRRAIAELEALLPLVTDDSIVEWDGGEL